jgi:hypothetical protein
MPTRGDGLDHAATRKKELVVPLSSRHSTLSSHRPGFAASRLRDSHNQMLNNKNPEHLRSLEQAVLRGPLEPGQQPLVGVVADVEQRLPVLNGQEPADAEVERVVDRGAIVKCCG